MDAHTDADVIVPKAVRFQEGCRRGSRVTSCASLVAAEAKVISCASLDTPHLWVLHPKYGDLDRLLRPASNDHSVSL